MRKPRRVGPLAPQHGVRGPGRRATELLRGCVQQGNNEGNSLKHFLRPWGLQSLEELPAYKTYLAKLAELDRRLRENY